MKKFFVAMFVAMLCMSAQAQEKGDVAIGLRSGVNIATLKIAGLEEDVTNFGIGAFGQYNLTDNWRLELEGIYHPMKDHVSDITVGLNVHYLFHLSDAFKIYPTVGYGLAFVHSEGYKVTSANGEISHDSEDETDGGIQLGLGLQYNLTDKWFLAGEYKYQPGILGDGHVIMASIGFKF